MNNTVIKSKKGYHNLKNFVLVKQWQEICKLLKTIQENVSQ